MEKSKDGKTLTVKEWAELRKAMINSAESPIDIIHSARDGTNDYDFDSLVDLEGGSQGQISLIKCKIDGKVYGVKQLTALKQEESDDFESEAVTELAT
jgi:hypothetical protein